MKQDVEEYVALCDTCQRVKAEHHRPVGLLQPLKNPEWKCVTPTFCKKNKTFCANRSTYKIIVLVKNFPKINLA
jgi:hypothetical protein